jgi:hypothetical protein
MGEIVHALTHRDERAVGGPRPRVAAAS